MMKKDYKGLQCFHVVPFFAGRFTHFQLSLALEPSKMTADRIQEIEKEITWLEYEENNEKKCHQYLQILVFNAVNS